MKMGLEVRRIFALAEGSFHIRKTKKATLGTSSKMSQNRTLRQRDDCKLSKWTLICSSYCQSTDILCSLSDFQFEQWVIYFYFVFLALSHISQILKQRMFYSLFQGFKPFLQKYTYLESPMSSYRTCRHLWGLVMLASVSGCQVENVDVFSNGEGEILPLYWVNLTTAVTVASIVSYPE